MFSQVAISHFKSMMLYITGGSQPLIMQFFVMNALLMAYAIFYRARRKKSKHAGMNNTIPLLVLLVNGITITGLLTPLFKTVFSLVA